MTRASEIPLPDDGSFVANITHFARALRAAGLPVGTSRIAHAIRAVAAAGFTSKSDFYWAMHACFVSRPEHRLVFSQIFRMYWRTPEYLEQVMAVLMPAARRVQKERPRQGAEKRAAQALIDGALVAKFKQSATETNDFDFDAALTFSDIETLRTQDFDQMTASEMAEAKRLIATLTLPVRPIASRRSQVALRGPLADWQGTMRRAVRNGGEIRDVSRRKRRERWPNLVAICDISGSMSTYSRAVLHFLHAASNAPTAGWAKVHSFTFGTQLTNITRHLHRRDVDAALALAGAQAPDWQGGTRIGACLHAFNRDWSRRVLGQGGVVLLITDGLDRDDTGHLALEMQRLHLCARRVIWLNPLLRWDGFAPKARGIREMLPHVDSIRAGHNIASLQALAEALARPDDSGEHARMMQMMAAR